MAEVEVPRFSSDEQPSEDSGENADHGDGVHNVMQEPNSLAFETAPARADGP